MGRAPFRIGIAGLGTVGVALVRLLQKNRTLIAARAGRPVEIVAVSARSRGKVRDADISGCAWLDNPLELAMHPGLDVVVELIGGADGMAKDLVAACLGRGRSVVTANKALLAAQGLELARLAEKNGATLMFEAAVAGGIPIVKALREGFSANKISAIYGILNGTCNYILTEMRETGRSFAEVLADAQKLGYAEADPGFDVDGIDAAHKLSLLGAVAFGIKPDCESVVVQGIRHITGEDIACAAEFGYRIKLLAMARETERGIVQAVEPCLVPLGSPIAAVEGVYNAVCVESDHAGVNILTGRGAGGEPTASAVAADIVDLARGYRCRVFGVPADNIKPGRPAGMDDYACRFYVRLNVLDRPGVLAEVSGVMRDFNISIEAVTQRGRDPGKPVSIVMMTHKTLYGGMRRAMETISNLPCVSGRPGALRIESF